jgi:hypothetical protein
METGSVCVVVPFFTPQLWWWCACGLVERGLHPNRPSSAAYNFASYINYRLLVHPYLLLFYS